MKRDVHLVELFEENSPIVGLFVRKELDRIANSNMSDDDYRMHQSMVMMIATRIYQKLQWYR